VRIRRLGMVSGFGLLGLFVGQLYVPACVADEWKPVTPEELKMTSEPLAPGAPAIYLYRQVDRDDSGQATTEYNYVRIKILTEQGRDYANVEIPFEKQRFSVSHLKARTIRPDGSIVNFEGKVYEKTVVKYKSLKYLAMTFTMPDVSVGSIIEYHFNYDFLDSYIFDSNWIVSGELFTKHAEFTLKPYREWSVRWMWPAGLPPGTPPPKEGSDGVIRMTGNDIPAFQEEEYMPPENELKFRINFVYSPDRQEMDEGKYWKQFNKKMDDRVEHFVGKHKEMEEAVAQIVSPGDSPEVKLQKIYARTQKIRNLSFETSKSVEEEKRQKIKPANNVADVWKNGFGTGEDITWLFLGLARAAGFEASPCLVSSRREYFFHKERLNGQELDTNVVLVKLNGKDTYLDPGTAFAPFGLLPWTESGVGGLKLDKESGTWIQTDLPDSDVSRIERTARLNLTSEGSLEGKLTVTYTGLEALSRRMEERNDDETGKKKYLEDEIKDSIPAGSQVELTNTPEWNGSAMTLVAEFSLKIPGWVSATGHRGFFPIGFFSGDEKHMFEHASRVYPVYFSYHFEKIDDVSVEMPFTCAPGSIPKPFDLNAKAAEYSLSIVDDKSNLHIRRELRSDVILVPTDMYDSLRNFYQIVRSHDDQQVVLQLAAVSAGN